MNTYRKGRGWGCYVSFTQSKVRQGLARRSLGGGGSFRGKKSDKTIAVKTLRIFVLTLAVLFTGAWLALGTGPVAAAARDGNFDRADLDTTCKPCQDFYQFATGGWAKRHPIQPSYATWGRFSALADKNQLVLRKILEDAARAKNAAAGTTTQKIGDFYASCMESTQIETAGIKPIQPEMARIAAIRNLADLQSEVARLQNQGVGALFYFGSGQDDRDSTQMIAEASQGGMGLPSRDDYLDSDDHAKTIREQYRQHITNMFALAGDAPAAAASQAAAVLAVETRLAQSSKSPADLRDPQANYHKMTAAELRALTPGFSWDTYFGDIGFPAIAVVNVGQPEFFGSLNQALASVSLDDWKTYLRWHLLHSYSAALSSPFVDENFSFYGKVLTGAKEIQPRWKRCVSSTDRNLGEALGQVYVAKVFPPETKVRLPAPWWITSWPPSAPICKPFPGWAMPRASRLSPNSPPCRSRSATPTAGATTPPFRSSAHPTPKTSRAAAPLSFHRQSGRGLASPWTAPNGA